MCRWALTMAVRPVESATLHRILLREERWRLGAVWGTIWLLLSVPVGPLLADHPAAHSS